MLPTPPTSYGEICEFVCVCVCVCVCAEYGYVDVLSKGVPWCGLSVCVCVCVCVRARVCVLSEDVQCEL